MIMHADFRLDGISYDRDSLLSFSHVLCNAKNEHQIELGEFLIEWLSDSPDIKLQTSGSTGKPTEIIAQKSMLAASAMTTINTLGLLPTQKALLCLPVRYIAAKMMLIRALLAGLWIDVVKPSSTLSSSSNTYDFTAMTPHQLENSIAHLDRFKQVIVGGATVEVYGKLVVQNDVTLTIEPGVAVRFYDTQTALTAPALVVAKGGTIMAEGTPTHPIVFTSLDDPLDGTFAATEKGLWGGIVILGTATVGEDGGEDFIEGIAAGADWAKYGPGTGAANDTESSGVLKYVSIRHGGADIGDGNELNGLTLGGVGSGTVIENVEVVSNLDDGIELFGGTVNVTNFLAYNCDDDAVDIDEAYSGTIDNVFIALGTGSDNIFEIDGTEDSSGTITGSYTITNVTAYGDSTNTTKNDQLGDQKKNATGTIDDVVLLNFKAAQKIEGIDQSTFDNSSLIFKNYDLVKVSGESDYNLDTVFSGPEQIKNGKTESDGTLHVEAAERNFFEFVDAQVANTGANENMFRAWTLYANSDMYSLSIEKVFLADQTRVYLYPNPVTNTIHVMGVDSKYFDIQFSSRCWDIESAKRLEFQSWSNRTHLSVGDAIVPMSYRWGFDSPSNCFIKNIEKIEG